MQTYVERVQQLEAALDPVLQRSCADMQAATAAPAGNERPYVLEKSLSLKGQDSITLTSGKRNAGRQREEGTVLRVVRAVTGSSVKPLLVSQSSLPAVEHAAPTKPSQPPTKAPKTSVEVEAVSEADIAAEEHTAMLRRYREEWAITEKDSIWSRLYK